MPIGIPLALSNTRWLIPFSLDPWDGLHGIPWQGEFDHGAVYAHPTPVNAFQFVTILKNGQVLRKGILQKAREAVIEILEVRFADVPRSITETIQGIDDLARLNRLLKQAATTASLLEFESILESG